jgi:hypothetical protein
MNGTRLDLPRGTKKQNPAFKITRFAILVNTDSPKGNPSSLWKSAIYLHETSLQLWFAYLHVCMRTMREFENSVNADQKLTLDLR